MRKFIAFLLCGISAACVFMLSACSTPTDSDSANKNENSVVTTPNEPNKESDIKELAQFELYADVGDKYNVVMQPFKNIAEYIFTDLTENNIVSIPGNAVITSIRYLYGSCIDLCFRQIPKIYGTETNSDFLYKNFSISLNNFIGTRSDWHEYEYFLKAERGCAGAENYDEIILPHAERIANKIKAQYDEYKADGGYEYVSYAHNDTNIVLKADSFLSETHKKIITNLNAIIEKNNLPLLSNQDIKITPAALFSETYNYLSITVDLQNYHYEFTTEFNKDNKFSEEWIHYYKNVLKLGYWTSLEELTVPKNDEYAEFFDKMKIEQFTSLYFLSFIDENSMLYFN